tara:strand:+ start:301 stop:1020 length:720 start_codon:yes stop_codon:yes gene_type:complete
MTIDNNQIHLSGYVKIFYVLITVCLIIYLIKNDNWYQALIVLNIALHYRDFIEFFTDFSDENLYPEHLLKSHEKDKLNSKLPVLLNETFSGEKNNTAGPSNIGISHTYNSYYDELYDTNVGEELHYSSFFNNNTNIKKKNTENVIAEKFYQQLYNKYERDIKNKSNINFKENFINYKLGETDPSKINDFGSFSKLKFQRDQKIYSRAKTPYPNDDIKLMNHVDLNYKTNWWETAMDLAF